MPMKSKPKVSSQKHPMAQQLMDECEWMADRLTEARELIGSQPIIVDYDNGGGQSGTRRNPAYDAYNALFASFVKGMNALDAVIADGTECSSEARATLDRLRVTVGDKFKVC